jgi:hypothetical protein
LFLDCVLDEFMAAILLLTRRANKDYSPDTRPSEFLKFDGRKIARRTGQTSPWQLFEAWVKARQPAASGVNRWRCVFLDLEQRFGRAAEISEDDARDWSQQLVTPKRKPRTVNDVWLTATVFAWGQEERLITSNPFAGVRVTEPRRVKHRETDAFMAEMADDPESRVCDSCAKDNLPRGTVIAGVAQGAAQIVLNGNALRLQKLAVDRQHPQFLTA